MVFFGVEDCLSLPVLAALLFLFSPALYAALTLFCLISAHWQRRPLAVGVERSRRYDRLAERVAHLSETGTAMDWYGGPVTQNIHQFLYGVLMRAVLTEGAVLGMLSIFIGHT